MLKCFNIYAQQPLVLAGTDGKHGIALLLAEHWLSVQNSGTKALALTDMHSSVWRLQRLMQASDAVLNGVHAATDKGDAHHACGRLPDCA